MKTINPILSVMALVLATSALLAWGDGDQKTVLTVPTNEPQSATAQTALPLQGAEPGAGSQTDGALAAAALDADTTLAVKVSFEARRLLLNDVLHNLQEQSGVVLQANADTPARQARLTARVKDMPLAKLMNVLSRIYGVRWAKSGEKSYLMLTSGLTAEQLKTLQIGDPYWFKYRGHMPGALMQKSQELSEVADEARNEADEQQLRSAAGVPIASLSPELQQKIRHHIENQLATPLVERENRVRAILQQEWTLKVGLDPGVRTRKGDPVEAVRVIAADGSFITYLPLNTLLRPPAWMKMKLLPKIDGGKPPSAEAQHQE